MKIWFIFIGEPLPVEKNVRLHRYGLFTKFLAKKGHDITWWTSTFSHNVKKNFFDSDTELCLDSVSLKFIYSGSYKKNISIARILHHKIFAKKFFKQALLTVSKNKMTNKPDLIICSNPTIDNVFYVRKLCKKLRVPFLIDFRDFWPNDMLDLFPRPLSLLGKVLLSRSFYQIRKGCQSATGIMASSPKLLTYGLSFASRKKQKTDYVMLHGYPDVAIKKRIPKHSSYLSTLGIDSKHFNICFFGTIGKFFQLDTVIEAAKKLSNIKEIKFILCGSGDKLSYFENLAKPLSNVLFPGWVNQEDIQYLMSISAVGLAPYINSNKFEYPNKLFEYLSAGLPIISSLKGEISEELRVHKCGYNYDSHSEKSLRATILTMFSNKEKTKKMGKNAQHLFQKKYSHSLIFTDTEQYLKKLIKQP